MHRYFNVDEQDRVNQIYYGYGIGANSFVILPIVALLWLFQPISSYLAQFHLYPEEFYWLDKIIFFLALGVANWCQWTREKAPLTTDIGNDRMTGWAMAMCLAGFYVNI